MVLAAILALALFVLPSPVMHAVQAMPVTAAAMGVEHCADHGGSAPAEEVPQGHKPLPACCTTAPCAPSLDVLAPVAPPAPAVLAVRPEVAPSTGSAGLSLPPSVPPPRPVA